MDKEEVLIQNTEYLLSGLAQDNWRDFLKDEDAQHIARVSLEVIKRLHEKQNAFRHGQWLGMEYDGYADGCPVYDTWACSECEYEVEGDADVLTNFCPNCGAKMDRVTE